MVKLSCCYWGPVKIQSSCTAQTFTAAGFHCKHMNKKKYQVQFLKTLKWFHLENTKNLTAPAANITLEFLGETEVFAPCFPSEQGLNCFQHRQDLVTMRDAQVDNNTAHSLTSLKTKHTQKSRIFYLQVLPCALSMQNKAICCF